MNILVTGASRGIGRAIAQLYAENAHNVLGLSRSTPEGEGVAFEWRESDMVRFSRSDLGELVNQPIDRLFLCHAIFGPVKADLLSLSGDALLSSIQTNCVSQHVVLKQVLSNLKLSDDARVSMLISKGGIQKTISGTPSLAYRGSKAAQIAYGMAVRDTLTEAGVDFTMVNPGWVRTRIGGRLATLSPEESASAIHELIEAREPKSRPFVLNYDGTPVSELR